MPSGGFTTAYQNAAAAGTATVSDSASGLSVDHVKTLWRDPTIPLRERVAARVAASVRGAENPQCLDVGCAAGGDLALLHAALAGQPSRLVGLDLLEAQLVVARGKLPQATFVQGDVARLPFPDGSMDSVQASRLLIHSPDLRGAVAEMVRVLKPGAAGVFVEGDFGDRAVLTSDGRIGRVAAAKQAHVVNMCANPHAAGDAYRHLISLDQVEAVTIESWSCVVPRPTDMDPDLTMDQQFLRKLVETGAVTQSDMDYYVQQATGTAAATGNFLTPMTIFEVGFTKRKAGADDARL